MRFVEVRVERNEHLAIARRVVPWEIPVLKLIHGDEKVIETGKETIIERDYPAAAAEFDRMAIRYGSHVASETPFVAMVFGQPPKGVQALEEMIEGERAAEAKLNEQLAVEDPTA